MTATAPVDTQYSTIDAALASLAKRPVVEEESSTASMPPGHYTNMARTHAKAVAADAERIAQIRQGRDA